MADPYSDNDGQHARSQALAWWYDTPRGQRLRARIIATMPTALARVTGTEHLQVCEGDWPDLMQGAHVVRYGDVFQESGQRFPKNSLDSIVLVNTLDVADQAQQVLHIADQLVTPSGTIIIVSFNPCSPLGARHLFHRCLPKRWVKQSPWSMGFYGKNKLQDWLRVLNYDAREFYVSVDNHGGWGGRIIKKIKLFTRKYGILPNVDSVTVLVAKKPWFPMTGITSGQTKRRIPRPLAGIALPTPSPSCEKNVQLTKRQ